MVAPEFENVSVSFSWTEKKPAHVHSHVWLLKMLLAGGYAHIPMFWTHLECSPQWRCWKRSSLPCLLRLCLRGRWTVSLIFFNLSRFENDTTRHFLENGVLGMVALGTGVTPPMYGSFYVFWFFSIWILDSKVSISSLLHRWSSSGCGCSHRWMPTNTQRRELDGFSGALSSRW